MDSLKRTTIAYRLFKKLAAPVQVAPIADRLACAVAVPMTAIVRLIRRFLNVGR